jgi:hypothetical protein
MLCWVKARIGFNMRSAERFPNAINFRISVSPPRRGDSIMEINELHMQSPEGATLFSLKLMTFGVSRGKVYPTQQPGMGFV